MKTQSDTTNKSASVTTRKSSHVIDEPKATANEEREGLNRPRLSRRACALLSWAAVAIMLVFIFCMSAKTGNDLDNHSGIISIVKNFLVAGATALFGREVDVSPVGHFTEYLLLGARRHARRLPQSSRRAHPLKPLRRKRRVPSDFYPRPKLRPYGLACRHLRRSHWGRYRMDAFEEA